MRSYKEIADIVREQGDAILERRRIRAQRIKRISCAVSGLCAAVIIGVAVWHNSSFIKSPDDIIGQLPTETSAASAAETTETVTEAAAVTTTVSSVSVTKTAPASVTSAVSTNTEVITSVRTSQVIMSGTSAVRTALTTATTVNENSAEYMNTTNTSVQAVAPVSTARHGNGNPSNGEESEHPVMTTTTASESPTVTTKNTPVTPEGYTGTYTTTSPTIATVSRTTVTYTTTDIKAVFRTSHCTVTLDSVEYEKENSLVPENWIGIYITKTNIFIQVNDDDTVKRPMEVYEIADIKPEEAVAVRLLNTDEYYWFRPRRKDGS